MLAQAKAQPDRWARDLNAGVGAVQDTAGGYMRGLQMKRQMQEYPLELAGKQSALYDHLSKLAEQYGPDKAAEIMAPVFKGVGMTMPTSNPSVSAYTPEQLSKMPGVFAKNELEKAKTYQGMEFSGPEEPKAFKASVLASGQMSPEAFDSWSQANMDKTGMIPRKNADQLKANLGLKSQASRSGYYEGRLGTMQLSQLPSQMATGTIPGAAAGVKMAARQGKSLIAKATSPQNLKLASVDLTRAVARMAPDAATIGESNYGNSLPTLLGRLTQTLDSDPSSPDVPKLRKQIYDTLDELDKSATPFILNHLQNMEANGTNSTFGGNWNATKQRELGMTIPDIPFDPSSGSSQNPNISSGIPQGKVKVSKGSESYYIDPAEVPNAQKDGFIPS